MGKQIPFYRLLALEIEPVPPFNPLNSTMIVIKIYGIVSHFLLEVLFSPPVTKHKMEDLTFCDGSCSHTAT